MEVEKQKCGLCGLEGEFVGVGTASGRFKYRCTNGHEWFGKNLAAQALGRLGGKARAEAMTPEERSESARIAAKARAEAMTPEERAEATRIARAGRKNKTPPQEPPDC